MIEWINARKTRPELHEPILFVYDDIYEGRFVLFGHYDGEYYISSEPRLSDLAYRPKEILYWSKLPNAPEKEE